MHFQGVETLSNHWCHVWHGTADRPSTPPWAPEHERRKRTKADGNRTASTAPQIVPPSASGLPSLCPEMRSVNQFLPRRPRGAYFRGTVQWCMQSWTKNSGAWFPCRLVSSQSRINKSSQAPFRCSNWSCARCSSLSILCLLVALSRFTRGSKML